MTLHMKRTLLFGLHPLYFTVIIILYNRIWSDTFCLCYLRDHMLYEGRYFYWCYFWCEICVYVLKAENITSKVDELCHCFHLPSGLFLPFRFLCYVCLEKQTKTLYCQKTVTTVGSSFEWHISQKL